MLILQDVTHEDQCQILRMDAVVELRRTAEEQSSVHFQQIQYLEN